MMLDPKVLIAGLTILISAAGGHLLFWLFFNTAKIKAQDEDGTGKWIGYFERALVTLFVCLGLTAQTVFIFAVKAAVIGYRLPEDKDRRKKVAEYMLLGSVVSYFLALIIGLCGRLAMGLPLKG